MEKQFHGIPAYRIASHNASAVIGYKGGRLLSYEVNERPTVYFNPEKPLRSTHPCGPIFGPVSTDHAVKDNGQYMIGDSVYRLPQHGILRNACWNVSYSFDDKLGLVHENRSFVDNPQYKESYPFLFSFKQDFAFFGDALSQNLSFQHLEPDVNSEKRAPVDLAFHTYFPFVAGMRIPELGALSFQNETSWGTPSSGMLENTVFNDLIPRDWHFDLDGITRLHLVYPDGRILEAHYSGNPQKVVLWTNPAEGNFICIEPVLRGRNSLNRGNAVQVPPNGAVSLGQILQWID